MSDFAALAGPAAEAIDDVFSTAAIVYTPKGCAALPVFNAVPIQRYGDDPLGDGRSVRQRGYEIAFSKMTREPANGDLIVEGSAQLRVIEVERDDAVGAWTVMVESK